MNHLKLLPLSLFSLLFLSSIVLLAQIPTKENDDFENSQIRLNLMPALELDFDPKTNISFNFVTSDDIEYGVVKSQFTRFRIKATRPWTLSVRSLTPYFSGIGPNASQDMPPSVLGIKKSSVASYTPLGFNDVQLFTGSRGGTLTAGNDFNADIKFTPGFRYGEGVYLITLLYTLSPM